MESVFIGYFPKKVNVPDGYNGPRLTDICSVSTCLADGPPDGWIDHWSHNEHWVFATRERALAALKGGNASQYTIHAYRMFPLLFRDGEETLSPVDIAPPSWEPNQVGLEPLPASYRSFGFDVVETPAGCSGFGCSPLSCNGGWQEFETNEHCLLLSLSRAIEVATVFSAGGWEPGPYRIVEVLGGTACS